MTRWATIGRSCAGALLALLAGAAVQAAPVTFGFTGTVTQVGLDDLGTGLAFGDTFSGQYTFDAAALDAIPGAAQGSYGAIGPGFGLSVDLMGHLFGASGQLDVGTSNLPGLDQYTVLASDGSYDLGLLLEDIDGTAFASDALPALPPLLAAFEIRDFYLRDSAGVLIDLGGQIDTLTCQAGCGQTPMPEPGSLALVAIALSARALHRRRWHGASTAIKET